MAQTSILIRCRSLAQRAICAVSVGFAVLPVLSSAFAEPGTANHVAERDRFLQLYQQQRYAEAEEVGRPLLRYLESMSPRNDTLYAAMLSLLGEACFYQHTDEKNAASDDYFRRALEVRRKLPLTNETTLDDTLPEIYALPLAGCELAILSACQTNVGPQQRGEGIYGLSRGFLVAGARRVVASNWVVDDEAAASLISYFCGSIAKVDRDHGNADYATALQAAKRWVRQQDKWRSPYYWPTFELIGPN